MSGPNDLSGQWHGIFNYPDTLPANGFLATITDAGGRLSGTIDEIDAVDQVGQPLAAMIDGTHAAGAVRFTKFYDAASAHYDVVDYVGRVSADGSEITGRWQVAGSWGGSFIMTRADAAEAMVEEAEAVTAGRSADDERPRGP